MRRTLVLLVLLICSCSKRHDKHLYIGELYFSTFRVGSFYNLADSSRIMVEHAIDTCDLIKADSAQQEFIKLYRKLKKDRMLYKPFIDLRLNDTSVVKLYLDSSDYDRIKIYKRQYLIDNHEKIVIWGQTKELGRLDFPLLYCTKLVDVELTDGQTFPYERSKFRIDDYE